MRCEVCFGLGEVLIDEHGVVVTRLRDAARMVPCSECGGCGWSYCCSGEDLDEISENDERALTYRDTGI